MTFATEPAAVFAEHADLADMLRLLGMLPAAARERMTGMYRTALEAQMVSLEAALAQDAEQVAVDLTHKVAGSAAMMQDRALSEPAREMEKCLRNGAPEEAMRLWPLVQARANRTLAFLAAQAA